MLYTFFDTTNRCCLSKERDIKETQRSTTVAIISNIGKKRIDFHTPPLPCSVWQTLRYCLRLKTPRQNPRCTRVGGSQSLESIYLIFLKQRERLSVCCQCVFCLLCICVLFVFSILLCIIFYFCMCVCCSEARLSLSGNRRSFLEQHSSYIYI